MFIVMSPGATREQIAAVCDEISRMGLKAHPINGTTRTAIGVTGNKTQVAADHLLVLSGVEDVVHVSSPYRLASRESHPDSTVINVGGVKFGGSEFSVIAGPCAVESREQLMTAANRVARAGVKLFRGGAYKPRTSPYSFQGLGKPGLELLAEVRAKYGLRIVTEAIDTETIEMVAEYSDIIQLGARNMQNFSLLKKAGRMRKPVLLKRGMAATVEEFLLAAEYILSEGNEQVILCERGIRTMAEPARNVLDLAVIPQIKLLSHLPIIADPSHGTGRQARILPMSRASLAAGADGLLIEVHHAPEAALSDGPQAITLDEFDTLMAELRKLGPAVGRIVH
ncbi:3-deoxy-7-phosphoheptulonate synthase [candidate division GN15 bacterium]|uniref:3-deoxy-7-phosphoheptulonate synthase n=1 Tax=candidate division GN15 bacterium TaxID=2072418 RepID=A0A855X4U2_9BACT|nr:MAG: 3-deoxy-7-phosphoheptulonate synthase [candidate division GN15 bacterium]